jgi:cell division septum initiation protein DivIVA
MSIDHGDRVAADPHGELTRAVGALEARRFRGSQWLSADEVVDLARSADERLALLGGEVDRLRRENEGLVRQVEMLRHGALPSAAPQGPDPMVIELAVRAQDEVNRTISEASTEGAEIIADARRQAEEIIAEAHVLAGRASGQAGPPQGEELQRQVRRVGTRRWWRRWRRPSST